MLERLLYDVDFMYYHQRWWLSSRKTWRQDSQSSIVPATQEPKTCGGMSLVKLVRPSVAVTGLFPKPPQ